MHTSKSCSELVKYRSALLQQSRLINPQQTQNYRLGAAVDREGATSIDMQNQHLILSTQISFLSPTWWTRIVKGKIISHQLKRTRMLTIHGDQDSRRRHLPLQNLSLHSLRWSHKTHKSTNSRSWMRRVRTQSNHKKSSPIKKRKGTSTTLAIPRYPKHRNHLTSHKLWILKSPRKSSMIYTTMSILSMQARRQPRASAWMNFSTLNRLPRRPRRDIRNTITMTKKLNKMEENLPRKRAEVQNRSVPNQHLEAPVFSRNTLARQGILRLKFKGETSTLRVTIIQSQARPLKSTTLEALMTNRKFFGPR